MDVVYRCLKREKCEIKAMMWISIRAQKITIQWQYVTVWAQYATVRSQFAQDSNMKLSAHVLKILIT